MNLTELETHYEVNLIVDDLFSKQDWKDLNDADEEIDFDQDAAATFLWTKKIS